MPGYLATVEEVKRFLIDVFVSLGVNHDFALQVAESLLAADYRGHFCHGINRLENFVKDIKRKACDPNARPSILRETAATAWVDGNNGLGPVVANFCMELAIQKAKKAGIGWVVAKGSNNFGIAMWYSSRALEYNMVGMAFTNAPPLMSPTRSKTPALGTNPLSMAAPGIKGDSFILDMATTAASLGKMLTTRRAWNGVSVLTAVLRRTSHDMAVVPVQEARRFMIDALVAVGTKKKHAMQLADVLVAADYQGHYSHGLNRLDMYVNDIVCKTTEPNAEPVILKETPATAWVDGKNGLGPVIGNFCMDLAIKKAKNVGVGWVAAKGSNHFGIAGWYSRTALDHSMLGMSFTNTSPLMSPTRATESALGTNPLSLAAPAKKGDSFVLDMATTAVAVGKIEVQRKKGEPIPEGWAQGPDGKITTDADIGFNTRCLMPLGGAEITSGYKGYGLGLLVETFCGILSGSEFGPNIRKWMEDTDRPANLGQTFVAIDPNCFAPGFEDRMSSMIDHLRGMKPSDPSKPVLVAGDPERNHMKVVDEKGGVEYHEKQLQLSADLAKQLGVTPMKLK